MLWADTWAVGCGMTMFKDGDWWKKLYTCNYGPSGNILGHKTSVYKPGASCSACPEGTSCSDLYPGLCRKTFL